MEEFTMDNNYEQTGNYGNGTEISTTPQYGLDNNAKSNDAVSTVVKLGLVAGGILVAKKAYDGIKVAKADLKRGKEARLAEEAAAKTAPAQNVVYVQTPAPQPAPAPAPAPEAQPEANTNTNKK